MTKAEIGHLLKRYSTIARGIVRKQNCVVICLSGRQERIVLDREVTFVMEAFGQIFDTEEDEVVKKVIRESIVEGWSDRYVILNNPISSSSFYRLKERLLDKVYHLCILNRMVSPDAIYHEKLF